MIKVKMRKKEMYRNMKEQKKPRRRDKKRGWGWGAQAPDTAEDGSLEGSPVSGSGSGSA